MALKWYKKASVQAALVTGTFALVIAVSTGLFGLVTKRNHMETNQGDDFFQKQKQPEQEPKSKNVAVELSLPNKSGAVIKVDGNKISVTIHDESDITKGATLKIYTISEELHDPDIGVNLGNRLKLIGSIRIEEIGLNGKYAVATLLSGENIQKGDIVSLE